MVDSLAGSLSTFFDDLLGGSASPPAASPTTHTNMTRKKKIDSKRTSANVQTALPESSLQNQLKTVGCGSSNDVVKKKKKKKKKSRALDKLLPETLLDDEDDCNLAIDATKGTDKELRTKHTGERFTSDGFKIVTTVPQDDSDISDAFTEEEDGSDGDDDGLVSRSLGSSRSRNNSSPQQVRQTDDGYKIVQEIPADDSDVSDAFEEDDDDAGGGGVVLDELHSTAQMPVKKTVLKIMDDFGISETSLANRTNEKSKEIVSTKCRKRKYKMGNTTTLAQAVQKMANTEMQVFDFTKKRGSKKKVEKEQQESPDQLDISEDDLSDKELKRVRYDIFKLGMNGFHKDKKENTRIALAIKLGAKPPKNKAENYKVLMARRKEEKQKVREETERNNNQSKTGLDLQGAKKGKKDGKGRGKMKVSSGQVGHFKDGIMVLSKNDILKIQKS